jgi:hypothetical protein
VTSPPPPPPPLTRSQAQTQRGAVRVCANSLAQAHTHTQHKRVKPEQAKKGTALGGNGWNNYARGRCRSLRLVPCLPPAHARTLATYVLPRLYVRCVSLYLYVCWVYLYVC